MVTMLRGKQKAVKDNMGAHFTSPKKKRAKFGKEKLTWKTLDPTSEREALDKQLRDIQDRINTRMAAQASGSSGMPMAVDEPWSNEDTNEVDGESCTGMDPAEEKKGDVVHLDKNGPKVSDGHLLQDNEGREHPHNSPPTFTPTKSSTASPKKRVIPDAADFRLHLRWEDLLPTLFEDYLRYTAASFGRIVQVVNNDVHELCPLKSTPDAGYFKYITLHTCACRSVQQVLVSQGLFPTAPSQSRIAVSIDLLSFYSALFERSCDAVNALALALNSFYSRRGFVMLDKTTGERIKEPFRKSLGYAVQWFDVLRFKIEQSAEAALLEADKEVQEFAQNKVMLHTEDAELNCELPADSAQESDVSTPTPSPKKKRKSARKPEGKASAPPTTKPELPQPAHPLTPPTASKSTECDQFLAKRCPACFGGKTFGRSLVSEGADFHIATDGNFHHRHSIKSGAGIPFHDPKFFVPTEFVDKVGAHIESVRKAPGKNHSRKMEVPESALDECERSYEAANGDKKKAAESNERFDDQGLQILTCRHDIPIAIANIDTPGEQQKYALALILWFFQFIPKNATVVVLYDIGCVVDRSVTRYNILPQSILKRIRFTTTAMHAYGHQWSCQLVYNPRLCKGLSLTDGEGVERTWSKMRKLIGIVRSSSRARRVWVIDRQLNSIAVEGRNDLGTWIKRRLRDVNSRISAAKTIISSSGHKEAELREQWEMQKTTQLSDKAHTPAQVKADIECVMQLQEEVESLQSRISGASKGLNKHLRKRQQTQKSIDSLKSQLNDVLEEVEELFSSLKIHRKYPELKGLGSEFVRTLILASELKDVIRRQAVEGFFELERLDQAVGGRHQALGTKLHQQTRGAMNKRSPALLKKVKKYNSYCQQLEELRPKDSQIPLPKPLPTKVAKLREDPTLMQDVWMTLIKPGEKIPWMDDSSVRTGIQAVLKLDRCMEERCRLGWEADNLCRQFGRELTAVEVALRTPKNLAISRQLTSYRNDLLLLKHTWVSALASELRYDAHVRLSTEQAEKIAGTQVLCPLDVLATINLRIDSDVDLELVDVGDVDLGVAFEPGATAEPMLDGDPQLDTDDLEGATSSDSEDDCETLGNPFGGTEPIVNPSLHKPLEDEDLLVWKVPQDMKTDTRLAEDISSWAVQVENLIEVYDFSASRTGIQGRLTFTIPDIQILNSPTALLNDVCLNGCADILLKACSSLETAKRCALFTTYDLPRWRLKRQSLMPTGGNLSDDLESALWKNSKRTSFWLKDVWVLPIHRPQSNGATGVGHWVLAVAYLCEGRIYLYDSLSERQGWEADAKDVVIFFSQLLAISKSRAQSLKLDTTPISLEHWTVVPALTQTVQFNGHDCGLWVLVWILCILRGFHIPSDEVEALTMQKWRKALLGIVIQNTIATET